MNRIAITTLMAVVAAAAAARPAHAHTMSDGHLELVADGNQLVGTLDLAARDLHDTLRFGNRSASTDDTGQFGLDPGGDGAITWADAGARRDAIAKYVVEHLTINSDDGPCGLTTGGLGVVDRPDGTHVAIALTATCPAPPTTVTIDYRLLYELDAQHRGLLHIGDGRAIARDGGGPLRITVRAGVLARLAAAVPGGPVMLGLIAAVLALGISMLILRRTTRQSVVVIAAIALVVSVPVWWSIHRLVT